MSASSINSSLFLARPSCLIRACHCPRGLAGTLAYKYAQLVFWRLSHEALSRDPSPMRKLGARHGRQRALAKLAALYPGALRELTRLGAPALQWRQNQAAKATRCAPLWLSVVWHYHALWHRGLLYRRFCSMQPPQTAVQAAADGTLAKLFDCWYERAAGQSPWIMQRPLTYRSVPELSKQRCTLKQSIDTLLKQQFGLDDALLCSALWGERPIG